LSATFVLGDIHGYYAEMVRLLVQAGLIQRHLTWAGADATLILVGDYVNRGPDSLKVIDFLISLQIQAELNGGRVACLLGNHDVVLLAAHRFRERLSPAMQQPFASSWGGDPLDLLRLTPEHIAWFAHLPAMIVQDERLIMHADAPFYLRYGATLAALNAHFETLTRSYDPLAWDRWLTDFAAHGAFWGKSGTATARQFLQQFGGRQIIHGHTIFESGAPISGAVTTHPPDIPTAPYVYADGLCISVECGFTEGSDGFIYRLV
jgi:hypothetical protein